MKTGTFRIYLGAAPGVGKTYAMLNEGRRRRSRGTDVVVGFVETHGRATTAEQIGDLEIVPRKVIEYKGSTFEEMDVDAILARAPQVALVDELAHTNIPGSRNAKRCQDVEELLAAGITVISTLNIQHLESVNDVVEQITGVKQRETIPDAIVRKADQVELVDMAPEAIRRRMAHGNIYPPERIDTALGNYFRPGNLAALRELALLWVADRVEEGLADYRDRHGIDRPWETRERILVATTGSEDGDRLIRRAARIAARSHGDLVAVHVTSYDGAAQGASGLLQRQKDLVEELGGTYKEVVGDDAGDALLDAARSLNATQIVLGATRRSRYAELTRGSVINRVIRGSGIGIDVHVISREESDTSTEPPRRRRPAALPTRRVAWAFGLGAVGLPLLTIVLAQLRTHVGLPSILLLYLLAVVLVSAVGGLWPALATAVAGFLLANYYFTPPIHTFTISEGDNLVALVVFLAVAAVVSGFVALASRRAAEGARARAESEALVRLGGSSSVPTLLDALRRVLSLDSVTLLHQGASGWEAEASAGGPGEGGETPEQRIPLGDRHELVLQGDSVGPHDQRILDAFVAELGAAIDVEELSAEVGTVSSLVAARDARAALLASTGRGLEETAERLRRAAADKGERGGVSDVRRSADRLALLGADLVDLGRIESGELVVRADNVSLAEVLAAAIGDTCIEPGRVEVDATPTLPSVSVDPSLLRRALVESLAEAIDASPPDTPVRVVAGAVWPGVDVRIIDRRRSGRATESHAGAGAFVAQAFVLAMRGRVEIDETPGGGTTLVMRLPSVDPARAVPGSSA